jgi:hypothetical protein
VTSVVTAVSRNGARFSKQPGDAIAVELPDGPHRPLLPV